MSEQWKYPEQKESSPQERLKERLLSGASTSQEFLDEIFKLDQSSASRTEAEANAALLADPEVKKCLERDEEARAEYYNALSLSHFHIGQRLLLSDPAAALPELEAARDAAQNIQDEAYADWLRYIQATIAYSRQDIPALEVFYGEMDEGSNKEVVGRLLQGLREQGGVDYRRDYQGGRG